MKILYCPVCGNVEELPINSALHTCKYCGNQMKPAIESRKDIPKIKFTPINKNINIKEEPISSLGWKKPIQKKYVFNENNTLFSQEWYDFRIKKLEEHKRQVEVSQWTASSGDHRREMRNQDNAVRCPHCGSNSISTQQQFKTGKAIIGTAIAGAAGALIGGKGSNEIMNVCQNCGHKWKPGSR